MLWRKRREVCDEIPISSSAVHAGVRRPSADSIPKSRSILRSRILYSGWRRRHEQRRGLHCERYHGASRCREIQRWRLPGGRRVLACGVGGRRAWIACLDPPYSRQWLDPDLLADFGIGLRIAGVNQPGPIVLVAVVIGCHGRWDDPMRDRTGAGRESVLPIVQTNGVNFPLLTIAGLDRGTRLSVLLRRGSGVRRLLPWPSRRDAEGLRQPIVKN